VVGGPTATRRLPTATQGSGAVGTVVGQPLNRPLAELFRYNRWANLRLIEACAGLTDQQLATRAPGASGSIAELLTHVVGGQQTFALRTRGRQHEGELTRGSVWPGIDTVRKVALSSSDELIAIAEGLEQDVDVDLPYGPRTYRFPRSFFLTHALEHGVEHRTEIRFGLAHLGIEAPDLDGWSYAAEAGYGREVG
jgi:uncharacterized damage-inducible protein DinB